MRHKTRSRFIVLLCITIWILPVFAESYDINSDPIAIILDFTLTEGYSINWDHENIISNNVEGIASITLYESGYADIDISFFDGHETVRSKASKTPITKNIDSYSDDYSSVRLGIADADHQLFASIYPFDNKSIYISISAIISSVLYSGSTMIPSDAIEEKDNDMLLSTYYSKSVSEYNVTELPQDIERGIMNEH